MSAATASTDSASYTETRLHDTRKLWGVRLLWLVSIVALMALTVWCIAWVVANVRQSCLCNSLALVDQRDGNIVLEVVPDTPAAALIQDGDIVTAIDGVPLTADTTTADVVAITDSNPPNTPIIFTLRTGDAPERDVTLTTYWSPRWYTKTQVLTLDLIQLVVYVGVAMFIALRRSDDWMALFTAFILITQCIISLNTFDSATFNGADPWLRTVTATIFQTAGVFFLVLFPNGRLLPRWSIALPVAFGIWIYTQFSEVLLADPLPQRMIDFGFVVVFVLLLRYRYIHVFTPLRRQQTKWVILGIAIWLLLQSAWMMGYFFLDSFAPPAILDTLSLPLETTVYVAHLLVPLTFAFAALRYRLYDIDLVINRSLVYGVVTVGVAVIFLAVFGVIYVLMESVLGAQNVAIPLAVGAFISAFAFNRMRQGVQEFVDRRIFRLNFNLNQLARAQQQPDIKNPGALTGQTLGGYQVLGVLGKGGMGEVYQGQANGQTVALKVLPPDLAQQTEFVSRFEREANAMRTLSHPNIVKLLTAGEQDGVRYLVLEHIDGRDLADKLKQDGKLPYEDACTLIRDLAAALDYAHAQGLVHRDIKSSNVMVRSDDPPQAVLMDFGIAKIRDAATRYTGSGAIGTIDYMAPEQIMAAKEVDRRADVYALGVLAYEMLAGEKPFKGGAAQVMFAHLQQPPPDIRDVAKDIPKHVAQSLEKALAKNPQERYQSAGEFAAAL